MMKIPFPVIYVTRDIERAIGIEPRGNYFIISNDTKYGREIQEKYPDNIWLIENENQLDTFELLSLPRVQSIISDHTAHVLVFQNTPQIERLAVEKGWKLLNPKASIALEAEQKISQVSWLGELSSLLPPHEIKTLSEINSSKIGFPMVLQFNTSHTGEGTIVARNENDIKGLSTKFPNRPVRITKFVDGDTYTINAVVWDSDVLVGNTSLQITGLKPFTDLPFATVGNDWTVPLLLPKKVRTEIRGLASIVGNKLKESGWKGLFGIDVIYDSKTDKIYLIEINARQPASVTCEVTLSQKYDDIATNIFEAHMHSLLDLPISSFSPGILYDSAHPHDEPTIVPGGAQIVQRMTKTFDMDRVTGIATDLHEEGFSVITYDNPEPNREVLRIRSKTALMQTPKKLWETGEYIKKVIEGK